MAKGFKHGAGGGASLNFKVIGNPQPSNPVENTIWVDTDTPITSWVFSATEPGSSDVMALSIISGSPWYLSAPQSLSAGDVLSFEIPGNVSNTYEAINIADPTTGDEYFVRNSDGSACNAWVKGTKVSVVLSNDTNQLNGYGGNAKTAYIRSYGSYGMTEGMVWIATGTTSTVEFNALKKNGITVYPLSAKQYVSGAWVDKTAKSYKNGEWVEWIPEGMLYYRGNECDPVTGGWSAFVGFDDRYTLGSYTEGSDRITLKLNGDLKCVSAAPANKIDLSKASTLIVNVKRAPSEAEHGLYVTPVRTVSACDRAVAKLEELKTGKNVLDVSSLSGQYYIVLNIVKWDSSTDRLEFDEVRYE